MGNQPWIPVNRQVNLVYPLWSSTYMTISGIIKVKWLFSTFGLLALFISRFVPNGCLRELIAQLRTFRSAEAFTSTWLSPTWFCFSSCSPACCAIAGVRVLYIFRSSFGNRWGIACFCWSWCCCLTAFGALQGVIWLAIATSAGLPQMVSPSSIIILYEDLLYLSSFYTVVASFCQYTR